MQQGARRPTRPTRWPWVIAAALTSPAPPGPALRIVDLGPARRLPAGAQGHRHAAALAPAGDLVRRARGPRVRGKKGRDRDALHRPAAGRRSHSLDEMGPVSAKSYPGREPGAAATATGRPGSSPRSTTAGAARGYVFGAFCPATGAASRSPIRAAAAAHWVAFLEAVDAWLPDDVERIYGDRRQPEQPPRHRRAAVHAGGIRAGRWCSSPNTPPTSTSSELHPVFLDTHLSEVRPE